MDLDMLEPGCGVVVPVLHALQMIASASLDEYVPCLQIEQLLSPLVLELVPGGQGKHSGDPS